MSTNAPAQNMTSSRQSISYHTVEIQGLKIFYREAGPANAPTVLLLHGFPSSSRMWEPLLPLLAGKYHLIAPDSPGFGTSIARPAAQGKIKALFEQGFHRPGDAEDRLGFYLGRLGHGS